MFLILFCPSIPSPTTGDLYLFQSLPHYCHKTTKAECFVQNFLWWSIPTPLATNMSYFYFLFLWSQDSTVSLMTRLQVGWSWVWIPEVAWDFSLLQSVQTGSGAHTVSYSVGTGLPYWVWSTWGIKLTIHLCPVPRLKISGIIRPLPIHAFMTWKGTTLLLCCTVFLLLIQMLFTAGKILNDYKQGINRMIMGSRCNWKLILSPVMANV